MRIYSYYFRDHNGHFCTLKIVRGETGHSEATEKLTRTILHTALKLKERTRTSTANIAELIQQIQSTASALSKMNGVDESERIEKLMRFPAVIRYSRPIAELRRVRDGTGFPFEVQPTDSCRRFLDLAHINQRILVDLLLTC